MVDISKYSELIIWGADFSAEEVGSDASSNGEAAKRLYTLLERNGYSDRVIFFADSNPKYQGRFRYGKVVKKPLEILEHPYALVIINTISIRAIQKAMIDMGINNDYMIIPYYFYHGLKEYPYNNMRSKEHTEKYKKEIVNLFDTEDGQTHRYLDIIFNLRECGEDDLYSAEFYEGTGENMAYFCDPELAPKGDVTYIDVGAYVGDSIEPVRARYGDRLKKIIAFEPDSSSAELLRKYVSEKDIERKTVILPYALGAENREIRFKQMGMISQQSEDGEVILQQRAFDDLPEIDIAGDAMVKMDIEGAEMEALQGMKQLIKNTQPYLAICLYHKETDLYDIPHYIKSLCSEYRLVLRGGWHLECWAVPKRHFE